MGSVRAISARSSDQRGSTMRHEPTMFCTRTSLTRSDAPAAAPMVEAKYASESCALATVVLPTHTSLPLRKKSPFENGAARHSLRAANLLGLNSTLRRRSASCSRQ